VRLNGLGVVVYLCMTGWLLLSSVVRVMIELNAHAVDALPFVGFALGLVALAGIGFGRVVDPAEEQSRRERAAARRRAAEAQRTSLR